MAEMRCPKCGSKNFRSLQMIYESGTKKYERSHYSSKGNDSTTTSTTQTLLAQSVAPPLAPAEKSDYSIICGIIVLIGIYVLFTDFSLTAKFIIIFGMSFICDLLKKEGDKNKEWNETEYQKLYEEWQRNYNEWQHTYLCRKCGTRFMD